MDNFTIKHQTISEFTSDRQAINGGKSQCAYGAKKATHPLAEYKKTMRAKGEQIKMKEVAQLHGHHMALRLIKERTICAQPTRLLGKQSHHGLKMAMGAYDKFGPEDFMNEGYRAATPIATREQKMADLEAFYGLR